MKFFSMLFLLIILDEFSNAQNPLVKQWDNRFGGIEMDVMCGALPTYDDAIIIGGTSYSDSSGDKTQPSRGGSDFWIVKADQSGNKLWDKRFGGAGSDILNCFKQTADNGFILGGISYSNAGGDKTQPNWDTTSLYGDFWAVKTDSMGNLEWDRRFGGINQDGCFALDQCNDGGFLFGGYSRSDSSGDKSQVGWGSYDFWVVKTDSNGNKQWDKRFGGTGFESLHALRQTHDGGYVLAGPTGSGISGDKTQSSQGGDDYWVVKIDSAGNKIWDMRFGGSAQDWLQCMQLTDDGGILLGGFSTSGISGDKSVPGCGYGDGWLVKIDSLGNKQWDKDFGGSDTELAIFNIIETDDDGYMISLRSLSDMSCNKSQNNLGNEQSWFVKLNSLGQKEWDKTVFTLSQPASIDAWALQTIEGCYIFGNSTSKGIGGEKTVPTWSPSQSDFWIIKFCDTTWVSGIQYYFDSESLIVYPNPFENKLSIVLQNRNIKSAIFKIKNILGQTVLTNEENNIGEAYTKIIDLGFLPNGIYLLEVSVDGNSIIKKIIKK